MNWELLNAHYIKAYGIDTTKEYTVEDIPAKDLIIGKRLDLVAKYLYAEDYLNNRNTRFFEELYKKHISCITAGSCSEDGDAGKNTINDYIYTFREIIDDIREYGYDPNKSIIPVGADNVILDGAHRVAACAILNKKVRIIHFPWIEVSNDAHFFKKAGLEETLIDYLAVQYCRIKENTFAGIIWPQGYSIGIDHEKIVSKYAKIIYSKTISVSKECIRNLIIQIYCNNDWIGGYETHFCGASPQIDGCYNTVNKLTVYVLEANSIFQVQECKKEVREICNVGNYAMHSSDNQRETLQILNLLLNANSLHLLQNGEPDKYTGVNERIIRYKKAILDKGLSLDDSLIDGSSVLSLYGIRQSADLDYITCFDPAVNEMDISCHNDHSRFFEDSISEIIYNPQNYLYYNECKFLSLVALKAYKQNRGEKKDLEDVKLITSLDNGQSVKIWIQKVHARISYHKRNASYYFPQYVIKISRKLGVYEIIRVLYHAVRRKK